MNSKISRRVFLGSAVLLPLLYSKITATTTVTTTEQSNNKGAGGKFINGHIDATGKHFVSGFDLEGKRQFDLPLPDKAHGFAVDPKHPNRIVSLPTLPGTRAVAMDTATGKQLAVIKARPGRHYYGHGVFSPDGSLLFTSENISKTAEGVITVRDGKDFRFLRELPGYGIGPHDIRLLPDGNTLVIASGGIRTHPDTDKLELNLDQLKSALLFIDGTTGKLLMRREIPVKQLSIRHIDVNAEGDVLVACQYKGKREIPKLVGIQRGKDEIEMFDIDDDSLWQLKGYTASALIGANSIAAVTCPRGNRISFWDMRKKQFLKAIEIKDVGGVEMSADGKSFIASANQGELYRIDAASLQVEPLGNAWENTKWTNHMVRT